MGGMPSLGEMLRFQNEREIAIQCIFLLFLQSSLLVYKEKNDTLCSLN